MDKSAAIGAVIVDDEAYARKKIREFLLSEKDVEVVGEAGNGSDAIRIIPGHEARPRVPGHPNAGSRTGSASSKPWATRICPTSFSPRPTINTRFGPSRSMRWTTFSSRSIGSASGNP